MSVIKGQLPQSIIMPHSKGPKLGIFTLCVARQAEFGGHKIFWRFSNQSLALGARLWVEVGLSF
ncbi:MAG: hypothetical protein DRR08_29380 [Candidatus Parabeggiatoa sp. nov. 2]|nr:MAG: hypothetical protein B6247_27620 [Beggiatoa sp. 4572_84]RKZ51345.1 MAG: hypothetical protein DRR08_29380 [Gammaproteobacteria bacterium]